MLSDENVREINRQIKEELRNLKWAITEERRERALKRIKELKELMDMFDDETEEEADDEVIVDLEDLVVGLRELFRRKKSN